MEELSAKISGQPSHFAFVQVGIDKKMAVIAHYKKDQPTLEAKASLIISRVEQAIRDQMYDPGATDDAVDCVNWYLGKDDDDLDVVIAQIIGRIKDKVVDGAISNIRASRDILGSDYCVIAIIFHHGKRSGGVQKPAEEHGQTTFGEFRPESDAKWHKKMLEEIGGLVMPISDDHFYAIDKDGAVMKGPMDYESLEDQSIEWTVDPPEMPLINRLEEELKNIQAELNEVFVNDHLYYNQSSTWVRHLLGIIEMGRER
jgi:hypothetical protein